MKRNLGYSLLLISIVLVTFFSCSKGGDGGYENPPANPCNGVTVNVTATVTSATAGQSNGSIVAAASGASGFTFKLNSGSFQSSGTFSNLAAGTYTVTAKSSNGCEGSASFTVGSISACAGTTISVTAASTHATPCVSPANGSITITASGSTGFTYSINGTTFQAGNVFSAVADGSHTVTVKDANGCTQTATVTVGAAAPGPLFAAVKDVLQSNCVGCHSTNNASGGMNWSLNCNIISNQARIKARAVDAAGTNNQMPALPNPALSAADQKKITDWITAGGGYGN